MADGGSVTVQFKADTRDFERGMAKARAETAKFEQRMASMQKAAIGIGIVGIAANTLGRNLQQLGDKASFAGRAGGFLADITSGNLVGAIKSAGAVTQLTSTQVDQLSSAWVRNTSEVYAAVDAYRQIGAISEEAARKIIAARAAINAGFALQAWQQQFGSAPVFPNDRAGLQGVGLAESIVPATPPEFAGVLNQNLQQRLARARAQGDKGSIVAMLKESIAYLNRIEKDPRIKGEQRTNLYLSLAAFKEELTALTKKDTDKKTPPLIPAGMELALSNAQATERITDDLRIRKRIVKYLEDRIAVEKDQNRKVSLINRLTEERNAIAGLKKEPDTLSLVGVSPSSMVGGLGAGSWLQGPLMQYAQSFGFKPRPQDYLKDIRMQVQQGSQFLRDLGKIKAAGGSDDLAGELAGMGPQGQQIAAALAKSPQLVAQYSRLVDKRASVAERLQVQSMQVNARSVIVNGRTPVGIDRNGNGVLDKGERFTVNNNGTPRPNRSSGNPMHR